MPIKAISASTALMFGLWLMLSGHYTGLLISLGLISAIGASLIAYRMGVLDEEGLPLGLLIRLPKVSVKNSENAGVCRQVSRKCSLGSR